MQVTLLGTGCPPPNPSRRGPATLVRHGPELLLIGCSRSGAGTSPSGALTLRATADGLTAAQIKLVTRPAGAAGARN